LYITRAATGMKKRLAEEWINFMLSDENQADIIKSQGVSPVVDVSARLSPADVQMFHVGDNDYFKTIALWRVMNEETENAFNDMWSKAKESRK
jgi:spermidine/putrescine transport system substrate-binding protein